MIRNPDIQPGVTLAQLTPGRFPGYCDPAHGPTNGMSSKGPDSGCIPLCRLHHEEMHRLTWDVFESRYGFDREAEATAHWARFCIDHDADK